MTVEGEALIAAACKRAVPRLLGMRSQTQRHREQDLHPLPLRRIGLRPASVSLPRYMVND